MAGVSDRERNEAQLKEIMRIAECALAAVNEGEEPELVLDCMETLLVELRGNG